MANLSDMPTRLERVKNLLDVPPNFELLDFSDLTPDQRLRLAIWEIAQGIHERNEHGCSFGRKLNGRVRKVERWTYAVAAGFGAVVTVVALLVGIVKLVEFVRSL